MHIDNSWHLHLGLRVQNLFRARWLWTADTCIWGRACENYFMRAAYKQLTPAFLGARAKRNNATTLGLLRQHHTSHLNSPDLALSNYFLFLSRLWTTEYWNLKTETWIPKRWIKLTYTILTYYILNKYNTTEPAERKTTK